ncbi:hypothetical protein, partial [Escherichia coli]
MRTEISIAKDKMTKCQTALWT